MFLLLLRGDDLHYERYITSRYKLFERIGGIEEQTFTLELEPLRQFARFIVYYISFLMISLVSKSHEVLHPRKVV